MTTNYTFGDVLPKDATGQPFNALVDISTSQLDFAMYAGIAASSTQAKNYAFLGVATHKQSDDLPVNSPGITMFGKTGDPISVTAGDAQFVHVDGNGAVFVTGGETFTLLHAASVAASAATAHSIFGNYGGLSDINASIVLNLEVMAETNDAMILPTVSDVGGKWISTSATQSTELKPMTRDNASKLHFQNKTAGENATLHLTIWKQD